MPLTQSGHKEIINPIIIDNLPLWRVQWTELPGYQNELNVHVAHYTHMFRGWDTSRSWVPPNSLWFRWRIIEVSPLSNINGTVSVDFKAYKQELGMVFAARLRHEADNWLEWWGIFWRNPPCIIHNEVISKRLQIWGHRFLGEECVDWYGSNEWLDSCSN